MVLSHIYVMPPKKAFCYQPGELWLVVNQGCDFTVNVVGGVQSMVMVMEGLSRYVFISRLKSSLLSFASHCIRRVSLECGHYVHCRSHAYKLLHLQASMRW